MKRLHLVCNAHLDLVWLWEWEEGAAEALSTFRTAADFCETFDGFVFNHNEVILYQWIEEYEPDLFDRIQRLVAEGRWHIMGGWYLQPDCNMPSGESFVRQILTGRNYFEEKFGVRPTTAINFDPFGHTQGLVQILTLAGYDSYLFCRPIQSDCPLPADDFIWQGFDGSSVIAHRASDHYLSAYGKAAEKVSTWMESNPDKESGMVLWGVGNHGGGASRSDIEALDALKASSMDFKILHSIPEAYFEDMKAQGSALPLYNDSLNPFAVGCYTSQIRIKQKHRLLENELYLTEKMLAAAAMYGVTAYPQEALNEALKDLLFAEFHDILPGTSIRPAEESGLRLMDHGLEILSRLKARAFFALCGGQPRAQEDEIPILVYNPHPHTIDKIIECEFQLSDQNWEDTYTLPQVYGAGKQVSSQVEKELSNLNLDWRKRVVLAATLAPGLNRFDCKLEVIPNKPEIQLASDLEGNIAFTSKRLEVVINGATGLLDRYRVDGEDYLAKDAFQPLVISDNDDPWGMTVHAFREVAGRFELMSESEGARFSGVQNEALPAVRVIEDGDVRSVVESVLWYSHSTICIRYKLPKHGTELEIELRVYWNEKSRMLKLSLPVLLKQPTFLGQVAYGTATLADDGQEVVAQKWTGLFSDLDQRALTCVNDGIYGFDYANGELRLSLLRSAAYSGHPILDRPILPQDQFSPRIDQGERLFTFWINGGSSTERRERIDREALSHNEKPFTLSFFPSGMGTPHLPAVNLTDAVVLMTAFKKAEQSEDFIIRLFEPTGLARSTVLELPSLGMSQTIDLAGFEIRTLRIDPCNRTIQACDLLEQI